MDKLIEFVAHALGLLGMAGVALVPMRLWSVVVLRRVKFPLNKTRHGYFVASLVLIPIAGSFIAAYDTMPRVFLCLWDMRCGANRAGGLLNLALFGFSVSVVEMAWLLAKFLWARWYSLSPNNSLQRTPSGATEL